MPWNSTNRSPDELAGQLEQLYILLYNHGSLPVRLHQFEHQETVSDLAFDLQFVRGAYFPRGIDALMCDLNPNVCSRELRPAQVDLIGHPEKHVGGYEISPGNWTVSYGDTVVVIDLKLESSLKFVSRPIPAAQSITDVLSRESTDCSQYDTSCIDLVAKLNPYIGDIRQPSNGRLSAVMPVVQVSTLIPIRSEEFASYLREEYALYVDAESMTDAPIEFAGPRGEIEHGTFVEALLHIDENLYKKQVAPMPPVLILQGNFDNIHAGNLDLFELTRHPFREKKGSISDLTTESIPIGVIDYWVDSDHCHLQGKISLMRALDQKQIDRSSTCYEVTPAASAIDSHGTHVVGTITGGTDGSKFIGLYPQAELHFAGINPDAIGDPIATASTESDILMMSHARKVRVINISWIYPRIGNNDPIMRAVDAFRSTTLFVAASGNEAKAMARGDSGCIWDPSCQSELRPNVMSVVALTASESDPEVYQKDNPDANGSNYGTAFDIGATGQSVLSLINGDRLGVMSGTSQAAPQVTAAAGLVTAVFKKTRPGQFPSRPPSPAQIKNRLMYTADIFPKLLGSVYSGRLNIERAMAINEAQVVFDDQPSTTHRVNVVQNPPMIVCRVGGTDQNIAWDSLRRIATNKLSNSLVIFYEQFEVPNEPQSAVLKRVTDCELRSQSNSITFKNIDTNGDISRQMKDIVELTVRF